MSKSFKYWFENGSWDADGSDRLLHWRYGNWRDDLFYELSPGDMCFRWNKWLKQLVGCSTIQSSAIADFGEVWDNQPPGDRWVVPLHNTVKFKSPVPLAIMREHERRIFDACDRFDYRPFTPYKGQRLRPAQRYLSKVSPALAELFIEIAEVSEYK